MKKVVEKNVTKTVPITEDVICNMCGESCVGCCLLRNPEKKSFEGLIEVWIKGGYGAKLGEGTTYVFSLCESCLAKMFKQFKHPPDIYDDDGDKLPFSEVQTYLDA